MAIRLADTARPNNYVDTEHLGTFPVAYAEDVWFTDGTRLSEKTFSGSDIQVEELPLASADELGNIYQYIGETGTYQHGCFYECIENSGVYSWQFLDVAGKVVYNVETPPKFDSDEISYDDGTVLVFSGEDTHGFLKGHHYKYMEDFTIENINHVRFYLNSEHTTLMHVYMAENNIKVGNMLYRHYNGQEKYKSGLTVVAIEEDIVTLWDDPANTEIICEYGYTIEPTTDTANVAFGYIDIGGGSDYQFSEDFVNEENNISLAPTQRIFTGTQAEWDVLSTAIKKTYGQVNITDDEGSTQTWEDLSSQITTSLPGVTINRVKCYKKGNLVSLTFDIMIDSGTSLESASRIFENIPKPKNPSAHILSDVSNNTIVWGYLSEQSNGFLCPGYINPRIGVGRTTGLIEYFSED